MMGGVILGTQQKVRATRGLEIPQEQAIRMPGRNIIATPLILEKNFTRNTLTVDVSAVPIARFERSLKQKQDALKVTSQLINGFLLLLHLTLLSEPILASSVNANREKKKQYVFFLISERRLQ